MNKRKELTRRWRNLGYGGRLYWKHSNPCMRRFDNDDVAIIMFGSASTHYKSIEALEGEIAQYEAEESWAWHHQQKQKDPRHNDGGLCYKSM
jgi:hypothetical protein